MPRCPGLSLSCCAGIVRFVLFLRNNHTVFFQIFFQVFDRFFPGLFVFFQSFFFHFYDENNTFSLLFEVPFFLNLTGPKNILNRKNNWKIFSEKMKGETIRNKRF